MGVALDVVKPHHRATGFGEPFERCLKVHSEVSRFAPGGHEIVVQLVGFAVAVSPKPHERLAGRDAAYPPPERPLASILPDAAAYLEKGLLHHVFGVFRSAAEPARQVVDRHLESAIERLQRGRVTGARTGQHSIGIGRQKRIHEERPGHGE